MSAKPSGVFISMSVPRRYVQKCAPWSMTPFRNASPWTRLPMSRPCMSVIATMIVSIRPSRTQPSSSTRLGCLSPWPPASLLMTALLRSPDMMTGRRIAPAGPSDCVVRQARAISPAACWNSFSISESCSAVPWRHGPAEAAPRPGEVVHGEAATRNDAHDQPRGRVQRERVQEDRAEQDDPDDRQPGERPAPAPEAPGLALAPRLVAAHAEPDADAVGPVQQHGADRRDAADEEQRIATEALRQDVDEEDQQPAQRC